MSTERIRQLNDDFRRTFGGGRIVMSLSVNALPDCVKANALAKVAEFNAFTKGNDPHGEHDFGSFELVGRTFFWKIDYYDSSLRGHADDPSDPDNTVRILTLMLAEDY